MVRFTDRRDAGTRLAERLAAELKPGGDRLVLALPRGGVPVAAVVAGVLDLPLDVLLVRKLGVPGHPELAMGAIASAGTIVRNESVIRQLGVTDEAFDHVLQDEQRELERRLQLYRGARPAQRLRGRDLLIVDDGLATGATMKAAVAAARAAEPRSVTVAVPVGAPEIVSELEALADHVVCLRSPEWFSSVGEWYSDFGQTTDKEVRLLLDQANPG